MNNELHFCNSMEFLAVAKEKLDAHELDGAIAALAVVYSNVRELLEHAWHMKRAEVLDEQPPGMNTQ